VVAGFVLLAVVPALVISGSFNGRISGGGSSGSGEAFDSQGRVCLDDACSAYFTAADGGVTLVGAPFESTEGFTTGALAKPAEDLWVNTVNAQAMAADGGAGGYSLKAQRDSCIDFGQGLNDEICASGDTLTFQGTAALQTVSILQPANPASTTVRWFVGSAGAFFGFFPTTDTTGCAAGTAGGIRYLSTTNALVVCNGSSLQRLAVDTLTALPTCNAALEGLSLVDAASGGTSGARTRRCLCTSDGAGSPAYAWQNLATGTVDTSTTCAP
jgi:hypothetical protein